MFDRIKKLFSKEQPIIDLSKSTISYDGKTWNEIEEDTL